jgi:hypothetical protein
MDTGVKIVKIPAFIQRWAKAERISVTFSARPVKSGGTVFVKSVVDSGCPWTFISGTDVERCRSISARTFEFFERVNLGGFVIDLSDMGDVLFVFKDSEGKLFETTSRCFIGKLCQKGELTVGLPSVIGMDFLREKRGMAGFDEDGNPCMILAKK